MVKSLLLILVGFLCIAAKDRRPSPPYITGDGFRAHCRFVLDESNTKFDASQVEKGDAIFVKTEYLAKFFKKYHPKITEKYILVTHNSDLPIPGLFVSYLKDPKLIAWFGQNVEGHVHRKLRALPIGLENRYNHNGDPAQISWARAQFYNAPKAMLLYNNFTLGTSLAERMRVFDLFKDKPFCVTASRKPYLDYLKDLSEARFVLSPRGNGLDCHRTWEALYMGAIPIVKSSASDSMFQNLPVIIVRDWEEVTEEFLQEKLREISQAQFDYEQLQLDYWLRQIKRTKNRRVL